MLIALCLLGASSAAGPLPAGSLDPSFGSGGVVTHRSEWYQAAVSGIAVQPDGKIVVAADTVLARYLPNGSPDPSFGIGGYVKGADRDYVGAVALQPDGKIVVAGTKVARYRPDGSLDTSFGTDGVATTVIPEVLWDDRVVAAVLPSGKIVVAGSLPWDDGTGGVFHRFALARYTSQGSVDPTFGHGGVVETTFMGDDRLGGIVVLPSGKIVATGAGYGAGHGDDEITMVLARYLSDGSLDRSFGTDGTGKVITPHDLYYDGGPPALQRGKIIVVGSVVARFTADGRVDTTFGKSGFATFRSLGTVGFNAVAVQADGKIVMAGAGSIARVTPNGRLDKNFGAGGFASLGNQNHRSSLALQANGKILVGGGRGSSWTLARLIGWRPSCVVPRVSGETIAEATATLRTSHCARGAIGWYPSSMESRGRVIYTVPARGTHRPPGYAVELVVSDGH